MPRRTPWSDTSADGRAEQIAALRRMDGPTRVVLACAMSDDVRSISEAGIRHRHPEWSNEQVRLALLELLVGRDLARRVVGTLAPG